MSGVRASCGSTPKRSRESATAPTYRPGRWTAVIDTCNYYPDRDGHRADLDQGTTTSSELLQEVLPGARVDLNAQQLRERLESAPKHL